MVAEEEMGSHAFVIFSICTWFKVLKVSLATANSAHCLRLNNEIQSSSNQTEGSSRYLIKVEDITSRSLIKIMRAGLLGPKP